MPPAAAVDATVVAIPFYFGSMEAERRWLRRRAEVDGTVAGRLRPSRTRSPACRWAWARSCSPWRRTPARQARDPRAWPLRQGAGRHRRRGGRGHDRRRPPRPRPDVESSRRPGGRLRGRSAASRATVGSAGSPASAGPWPWPPVGLAVASTVSDRTAASRMWVKRQAHDRGRGPVAWALGHRRVGLHLLLEPPVHAREPRACGPSTSCTTRASATTSRPRCASRWPTSLGMFAALRRCCRLRRHPARARSQHGPRHQPAVPVLDPHRRDPHARPGRGGAATPPSHHRVHHGSNRQYLDRNHGSILIIWDRLFGTFEREDEPVVYGLTKNIDTFTPAGSPPTSTATSSATSPRRRPGGTGCPSSSAAPAGPTAATPPRPRPAFRT